MRKSIYIATVCILLFGCTKDKWFDAKQTLVQTVPQTVADFQAILDNVVMDYAAPYLPEIASDDHYVTDAVFNTLPANEKNAYTWTHDLPYTTVIDWTTSLSITGGTYARVYLCNLTLDGLKTAKGAGTADYNNVKGQALFYRAFNYHSILQEYAPVYDSAKAATQLGVPLRLESDLNVSVNRSTVKESYDRVLADLSEAISLLPVTPAYKTRPSKAAGYALMARLYLNVSDYADAGKYADSCLAVYPGLLNFNTLNLTATYPIPNYSDDVIFQNILNPGSGIISFNAKIDTALYNRYDANDLRKVVYFTLQADKSVNVRGSHFSNAPFNGLTAEEMLLIRAECRARQGQTAAAMADINTLLRSRYKTGTYVDQAAATADDALTTVLLERRKELVLSGQRWSDLRRFAREGRFAKTLTRTVAGKTYTLEPGSFKYVFPIPDDAIKLAPQLQQNPGW
ncbi:MAG: RagB/SusD family nutrient uptake outer membrane protein [Bacteroidetes bacterium]|nr:RagB/SusD family nutrient uptake outer membrane protein [Bacteroidota bacterium]